MAKNHRPSFIDLFAGAGGLSLGLMQAGWRGILAVEHSPMAFGTLEYNLIEPRDELSFDWPKWIPVAPMGIEDFLNMDREYLDDMKGIELLAGGPPCQSFSSSGQRKYTDERTFLFERYIEAVELLEPQMLIVENVRGFATTFTKTQRGRNGRPLSVEDEEFNAAQELETRLKNNYRVFTRRPAPALMARDYGVPQMRPRYIMVAIRKDLVPQNDELNVFEALEVERLPFLTEKGLTTGQFDEIPLGDAISDLEKKQGFVTCVEPSMGRFKQGKFGPIESNYQSLMRRKRGSNEYYAEGEIADSHRFVNHKEEIQKRFEKIQRECRPGLQLSATELERLNLTKHRIAVLTKTRACHTLTSLPDDMIHYSEPRILTVREYARIQSFPDWFEFKSKYTTGGNRRRIEIPRYTQIANAVPPLLAEIFGRVLLKLHMKLDQTQQKNTIVSVET